MELHILEHRVRVLSLARPGLWLYTHPLIKLLFLPRRSRCAPGFGAHMGVGSTVALGRGREIRTAAGPAAAGGESPLCHTPSPHPRPPSGLGLRSLGPPPIRPREAPSQGRLRRKQPGMVNA